MYEVHQHTGYQWESIVAGEFDTAEAAIAGMTELEDQHGWRDLRVVKQVTDDDGAIVNREVVVVGQESDDDEEDDHNPVVLFMHQGSEFETRFELHQLGDDRWSVLAITDADAGEIDWPSDEQCSRAAGVQLEFIDAGDHPQYAEAIMRVVRDDEEE